MKSLLLVPALALAVSLAPDPLDDDRAAVERACLDYVEGIYEVQPERIQRSVSKDLVKYGYWREDASAPYRGMAMTYDQLVKLAGEWNASGESANADSPKEVEVLDVMDKTAVAKLTAEWGVDHFQLEKVDGVWKIRHVLWQSIDG